MRKRSRNGRWPGQRGVVAILVALLLVVLIGFVGLVVDVGYMYHVRSELQNAVDAGATAGVRELTRTEESLQDARDRVREFTNLHLANQTQVEIPDGDIVFGHWTLPTGPFTPYGAEPTAAEIPQVNAVQVTGRRSSATGNPLNMRFAGLVGFHAADIAATAVAIGGCPARECGFPMVVADCAIRETVANGSCQWCMVYQEGTGGDNAGWTDFDTGVNHNRILELINDGCSSMDDSGAVSRCAGQCNNVSADTEVQVYNGNGFQKFCEAIKGFLLRHGPSNPEPFQVAVPVIHTEANPCDKSVKFSSTSPVVGFAVLEFYGVRCKKQDTAIIAPGGLTSCTLPPSERFIVAQLRCDLESPNPGGAECFGMIARRTRLVR